MNNNIKEELRNELNKLFEEGYTEQEIILAARSLSATYDLKEIRKKQNSLIMQLRG